MRYIFSLLILPFLFAGCTEDPEDKPKNPKHETYFEGVATTFEGEKFKSSEHDDILRELDICEFNPTDSTYFASCSPENFKISAYKNEL